MIEQGKSIGHEMVIGLVGAIGTDLTLVERSLQRAFETVGYQTEPIKLIDVLTQIPAYRQEVTGESGADKLYRCKMDVGNKLRRDLNSKDALALLGMAEVRNRRRAASKDGDPEVPKKRCTYILHSLKTPEEVEILRQVYGNNFFVIAAYASRLKRVESLATKIAKSYYETDASRYRAEAEQLVVADEQERGEKYGQNLRDAFWLADLFVDASSQADKVERDVRRFIELIFGHPFSTPTRDEVGMFQAYGSGLRSASAGRQVGAAISTSYGEIVATGANEVAKPFGGQYWSDDKEDHRDHTRPTDSNEEMARNMIADFLVRLKQKNWLVSGKAQLATDELLNAIENEGVLNALSPEIAHTERLPSLTERARVKHVIEYIRAVHAEMAGLMSAARRGVAVDGCTLYSTTFPCHECAKHIVVAGIHRVVFIEPYPKSRVTTLFDDSISVYEPHGHEKTHVPFEPFVGVAPRRYMDLFAAPKRKDDKSGAWIDWELVRRTKNPRLASEIGTYLDQEQDAVKTIESILSAANQTKQSGTPVGVEVQNEPAA